MIPVVARVTFRAWIMAQRGRDDGVGDVVRDVLADPRLRGRRLTPGGLLRYLRWDAAASEACLDAAERMVQEYQVRRRGGD
jgi:hypothetical protein